MSQKQQSTSNMKVYLAADHGGFEAKNELVRFVRDELSYDVEDCGADHLDPNDDYPAVVRRAIEKLSSDALVGLESRAIIGGGSGQGEAILANRYRGVRCGVYYGKADRDQMDANGKHLDIITSVREHNDANALSIGFRFLSLDEAKAVVREFLSTSFLNDERHLRRIRQLDNPPEGRKGQA